jgi:hypothetical protein
MTGNLDIKPVLDLGSQMKDFEGHGGIPVYLRNPANADSGAADVNFCLGDTSDIVYLANRFQYLSVNIP